VVLYYNLQFNVTIYEYKIRHKNMIPKWSHMNTHLNEVTCNIPLIQQQKAAREGVVYWINNSLQVEHNLMQETVLHDKY
jgi:hypothetical protein